MPKRQPKEDSSRIPVCKSDFLQDLSIELGKRLKSVRYRTDRLDFSVDTYDSDNLESFNVTSWLSRGDAYIRINIWQNRHTYYEMREPYADKHDHARYVRFEVTFEGWEVCEIANLLRNSLRDDHDVRDIWQKLNQKQ